jgi:aminopeptidase N
MKAFLSQKDAGLRAQSIEPNVDYRLYLCLNKGENFHGHQHITFHLRSTDNVFLDYCGKAIVSIRLNGNVWSQEEIANQWIQGRLTLPATQLHASAQNEIEITFSNQYYHDGNGIHTFIDSDGSQYTYCQSEPFWINKAYPVFDQPDIKGKMTFLIQAPEEWRVISNQDSLGAEAPEEFRLSSANKTGLERLAQTRLPQDFEGDRRTLIHSFGQTPLLPTYLYNFVTGPFAAVPYDGSDGPSVPMTIFCRQSQLEEAQVQKRDLFLFCKKGIEFFESFFQTRYPFGKYDFIFCPEFTVGAMEYPGAITFNDRFLYREKPTANQVSTRGKVVVHELAHMWFGNLVTMRWWNDLWLNESFADFACYTAIGEFWKELPFENVDGNLMFLVRKFWGYTEDQLVTTHPIACEVENTDAADSIFDGITYAKGAAVLKQLYFILGKQQFSANLGRYFTKYAWRNATLADFLAEMSVQDLLPESQRFNVTTFSSEWIEKAGPNALEAHWDPSVQGKSELVVRQTAVLPAHPTLRNHRIKVAFFDQDAKIAQVETLTILPQEKSHFPFVNNNYKAILLNYEDHDFVNLILDRASLDFFKIHLTKIDCWTSKMLILRAIFEMVRRAEIKATELADMATPDFLCAISHNAFIYETVLGFINTGISEYAPAPVRKVYWAKLFDVYLKLVDAESRPDILSILKGALMTAAHDQASVKVLKELFEGTHPIASKIKFSTADKWSLFFKIWKSESFTRVQKDMLRDHLTILDTSDSKKSNLEKLKALQLKGDDLAKAWDRVLSKDRGMSYTEMGSVLQGLVWASEKSAESRRFQDAFAENLLKVIENDQKVFAMTFLRNARLHTDELHYWQASLKKLVGKIDSHNAHFKTELLKTLHLIDYRANAFDLYSVKI